MDFTRDNMYTPQQVAHHTGVAEATLASWRSRGTGPEWLKCGKKIWYPVPWFNKWMEGQRNAGKSGGRKMALSLSGKWAKVPRSDRLGRHLTQSDRRNANRSRGTQGVLEGREDSLKLSVQLFDEAASMFLRWAEGEHRQHPETARRLAVSFASLQPFFGKRPVHSITAGQIEDYKSWRRTEHEVRDVTLRHDLHTLSKFFQYAAKHKWRLDNPVREVEIPSDADAERTQVLTEAEEMVYFEAAKRYPNLHDLGRVMIRQGCRPQEVMSLAQDAVDIENAKLNISKGKSKAARRTLKLVPEVAEILSKRIDGGRWVFPGKTRGTHCTKLNNFHGKVLAATGLKFVIYDLRHTFATRMAERGMDLATLASILGHSNIRTTQRYIHITQSHQDAAMRRFGYLENEERTEVKETIQ